MSWRGNSLRLHPWSMYPLSPIASLPEASWMHNIGDKHGPLHGFDMCIAKNEEVVRIDRNFAVDDGILEIKVDNVSLKTDVVDVAILVLSSVATVEEGKATIVKEGGIPALAKVIKDGVSVKGEDFVVVTLL
ncbi:hypothetical protein Tco_1140092 [Tanacetum coccineum]